MFRLLPFKPHDRLDDEISKHTSHCVPVFSVVADTDDQLRSFSSLFSLIYQTSAVYKWHWSILMEANLWLSILEAIIRLYANITHVISSLWSQDQHQMNWTCAEKPQAVSNLRWKWSRLSSRRENCVFDLFVFGAQWQEGRLNMWLKHHKGNGGRTQRGWWWWDGDASTRDNKSFTNTRFSQEGGTEHRGLRLHPQSNTRHTTDEAVC